MWVYFTPYFTRRGTNKWEWVKCEKFRTGLKISNQFEKFKLVSKNSNQRLNLNHNIYTGKWPVMQKAGMYIN